MIKTEAIKLAKKMPEWIETDKELVAVAKAINLPFYVKLAKANVNLFVWFVQVLYIRGYKIVKKEE